MQVPWAFLIWPPSMSNGFVSIDSEVAFSEGENRVQVKKSSKITDLVSPQGLLTKQ